VKGYRSVANPMVAEEITTMTEPTFHGPRRGCRCDSLFLVKPFDLPVARIAARAGGASAIASIAFFCAFIKSFEYIPACNGDDQEDNQKFHFAPLISLY